MVLRTFALCPTSFSLSLTFFIFDFDINDKLKFVGHFQADNKKGGPKAASKFQPNVVDAMAEPQNRRPSSFHLPASSAV